jgi:hypothetical protein
MNEPTLYGLIKILSPLLISMAAGILVMLVMYWISERKK